MNENELYHYGILGMKWGIRRTKGSMTSDVKSKRMSHVKKDILSDDAQEMKNLKKKKVSEMSNVELKKLNERQQLERTHSQLNKGTVAKGLALVGAAAATTNTLLNLYNNSDKLISHGKNVGSKILNKFGHITIKNLN